MWPMRMNRRVVLLVVGVGIMVAAFILLSRGDSFEPVEELEAQVLLNTLRTSCQAAASAIESGVGTVTVYETVWQENGKRRKTETTYGLVCRREKLKAEWEARILVDQWWIPKRYKPNPVNVVSNASAASNGKVATYYEPERKKAVVGDLSSGFPGKLLEGVFTITHAPGHAIPASVFDPDAWSELASPPHVLGRETVNGEECVVVQVTRERVLDKGAYTRTYKYWIDPTRGYSLVRFEDYLRIAPSEEPVLMTRADIETTPCENGLWKISYWQQDNYSINPNTDKRYLSSRSTIIYSDDYQLNASVTDDMLTINFPSGTSVYDELTDSEYTVP